MNKTNYLVAEKNKTCFIKIMGNATFDKCFSFKKFTEKMLRTSKFYNIVIDLTEAEKVDSTNLGIIAKYGVYAIEKGYPRAIIFSSNIDITQVLAGTGFSEIFEIVDKSPVRELSYSKLPFKKANISELKDLVLDAHEQLIKLNENNKKAFSDIVNILRDN
jgi:anti-anti-sigma regulatory factor